tara:strand:- start:40 stop:1116 length:1077 start_codon:yes stop_codon:yes gene_type:complete
MQNKIENNIEELYMMMKDLSKYTGKLGPGAYWLDNQKSTIKWLENNDLNFIFKYDRFHKSLSNFGGGSRWRSIKDIDNEIKKTYNNKLFYFSQKLKINKISRHYQILLRNLSREKYTLKLLIKYLTNYCKDRDSDNELIKIESSSIGNPSDLISINNKIYTSKFLDEFLKYLEIKKYVNFEKINKFLEIGPGVGIFSEVLAKLFNNLKIYLIDIPPQLYVTQNYLKTIFPNEVATYSMIKKDPSILNSKKYRIFIIAPWQLETINFVELDFAFNQVSFSEMRKETVESYLTLLRKWNTKIINLRSVEERKTNEGASFNDFKKILINYNILGKELISADFKEKENKIRKSFSTYFKIKK